MNALENTVATAADETSQAPTRKSKLIGLLLCVGAVLALAGGWLVIGGDQASTDNAYVRGDLTSLAAKVAGYVTTVEVEDNQSVQAGDVLFRIDDRDYRAHLAQATANVQAAKARLKNAGAESELQRALIRQAEAQRRSATAEMELANKTHDRSLILARTHAISRAIVDESSTARHRAEAAVLAASATLDAQQQRIAVLEAQTRAAKAALMQAEAARDIAQGPRSRSSRNCSPWVRWRHRASGQAATSLLGRRVAEQSTVIASTRRSWRSSCSSQSPSQF